MKKLILICIFFAPLFSQAATIEKALASLNNSMESTKSVGTCWHLREGIKKVDGSKLTYVLGDQKHSLPSQMLKPDTLIGIKINSFSAAFTSETPLTIDGKLGLNGTRVQRIITASDSGAKIETFAYNINVLSDNNLVSYTLYDQCSYFFTLK